MNKLVERTPTSSFFASSLVTLEVRQHKDNKDTEDKTLLIDFERCLLVMRLPSPDM